MFRISGFSIHRASDIEMVFMGSLFMQNSPPEFISLPGYSWWRHQMETFSALLAIWAGNSPAPGEFSAQRPVTWNFDVFFDLRPNKLLSKRSWGRWFEMPLCPLWRHCNVATIFSCDQAALQMVFSVCPSVRPSVCHTFLTMFPSSYHHEIFRSYYQWPK